MAKDHLEQVAVITPHPTRWEILFIAALWAAVILGYVHQCSLSIDEHSIPQILVTVTPKQGE
jgi:hypothetical protein